MRWSRVIDWAVEHRRSLLDLVRIYLGVGLLIKGLFYLLNPAIIRMALPAGWNPILADAVPWIHMIGGGLLAAGLLTRISALFQMPVVFVAVFFVNLPRMGESMQAREAVEFSALVLFLLAIFVVVGAGPLSLSHRLNWRLDLAPRRFNHWTETHPDFFLDLIRAYLGLGLLIKGFYILSHQADFMAMLGSSARMPFGLLAAAHYVIPVHFVGGIMLLLGFATRLGAAFHIPLLLAAMFYLYLPGFTSLELRQNLEFTGLVFFLLSVFAVHGAGRYSVDHLMERSMHLPQREMAPAHA